MQNILKDKVAVITGAGRGLGRAIAEAYGAAGCRLMLLARSEQELLSVANSIKGQSGVDVVIRPIDVSDESSVRSAITATEERFGQIDILINNAGIIGPIGPITEIDSGEWLRTIQINLSGAFYCIKAVLPCMKRQNSGRILNLSGGGALLPAPFFDAYSVTKAGIVRLSENLALELKDTGIAVCAISPGGVNTRMFDDMMSAGEEKLGPELWESFQKRKEAGGDSMSDVVELALFLATTDHVKSINGRTISAKWDPWRQFCDHFAELENSDIYTMRRIMPKDRNHSW